MLSLYVMGYQFSTKTEDYATKLKEPNNLKECNFYVHNAFGAYMSFFHKRNLTYRVLQSLYHRLGLSLCGRVCGCGVGFGCVCETIIHQN